MARISLVDEARLAVLQPLRARLEEAAWGQKSALVRAAAATLGCSEDVVRRDLRALGYSDGRKKREDAGTSKVTDAEVISVAQIIASAYRENDKRLMHIGRAMGHARANGWLHAQCSEATMSRRLRDLNVHPDQQERPSAHINLRSAAPNAVWQIDPSLCVLYRFPGGEVRLSRLDDELIYKNKLGQLEILNRRNKIWRYVQWDHYSSAFFGRYFETPGESAEVLLDFLLEATRKRERFLMHGWPDLIYWDKGSANTAAPVRNLLGHLGVRHETHRARNARAKGGVEGANNLIEIGFESGLIFTDVPDIGELNARFDDWQIDANSFDIVDRHGHTRYGVWQTIRHVRLSPPEERLRMLAHSEPVERKVNGDLTVAFDGGRFNVEPIEAISAGDTVRVARSADDAAKVWVLVRDRQGVERYHLCEPLTRDAGGFWSNAVTIGEEYRAVRDTPVDEARKDLREAVWGTRDENEAIAARKKGRVALDGKLDPFKAVEDRKAQLPQFMQRRGTELHVPMVAEVDEPTLSPVDLLLALRAHFGRSLEPNEAEAVQAWHPSGLPRDQFEALVARIEQLGKVGEAPAAAGPRLFAVG